MAQYVKTLNDVQHMMLVPTEEAAAAGLNFTQQQPPPQQHVQMVCHPQLSQSFYMIEQPPVFVQAPATVEGSSNAKVAVAQPVQSTMQTQPVQQEIQQQLIQVNAQQYSNDLSQTQRKPAIVRTYTHKLTNQMQVQSPGAQQAFSRLQQKKQLEQQTNLLHGLHPQTNQLVEGAASQTVQQSPRCSSEQIQSINVKNEPSQVPLEAASPCQQTIIIQPQRRFQGQVSPQLMSQQFRTAKPRLLNRNRLSASPKPVQTSTIQQQNSLTAAPEQSYEVLEQPQSSQQDNPLNHQNGILNMDPASPSQLAEVALSNSISSQSTNATAECDSVANKSQVTPKRKICEIKAGLPTVGKQSPQLISPNQQTLQHVQVQVKSSNQTGDSAANHVIPQECSILPQVQTSQPQVSYIPWRLGQTGQIRILQTKPVVKLSNQKQPQSPQQQQQQQLFQVSLVQQQVQQQNVKQPQQVQLQATQQVLLQPHQVVQIQQHQHVQQGQTQAQTQILYQIPIQLQQAQQVQLQAQPQHQVPLQAQPHHQVSLQAQQQVQLQAQQQAQPQVQLQAQQQVQLQAQQQIQLQAQQQIQLQAQQQVQLAQQAKLQAQLQARAQLQAQQQVQMQAQQQVQQQMPQQPLQQAQQTQLPIQQQAQLQMPQQPLQQALVQTPLSTQQQVQLQVQQQGQLQVQQAQVLPQQAQLQAQIQVQQKQQHFQQTQHQTQQHQLHPIQQGHLQQQQKLPPQDQSQLQTQKTVKYVQLPTQKPSPVQIEAQTSVAKSVPNVAVNQVQKVAKVRPLMHSININQSQLNNQLKPRGSLVGTVPRPQMKPAVKEALHIAPNQQQGQAQASHLVVSKFSQEELQAIFQQLGVREGHGNRILVRHDNGKTSFIIQQVPLPQPQQVNPVTEPDPPQPASQGEQIAVFEGVTVKDEFPTGVLQECVVSESGEIMLADSTVITEPLRNEYEMDVKEEPCDSTITYQTSESEKSSETMNVSTSAAAEVDSTGTTEVRIPVMRIKPGLAAVCKNCGITSLNFSRCQRCGYILPENVKVVSDHNSKQNSKLAVHSSTAVINVQNMSGLVVKREVLLAAEKLSGKPIARSLQPLVGAVSTAEVKRKRCSVPRKPKLKVPEEPEILTLSSDDEDKQEKKPNIESQLLAIGSASELEAETKPIEATAMEDPDNYARRHSPGVEGGGMLEQAIDGSMTNPYVLILCRTLRIGTYKAKPAERVVFSSKGLEMKVPLPTGPNVTVSVAMADIIQVLVSFCRSMPVLFIYIKPTGGVKVRQTLHMSETNKSYYFDPDSLDDTHKRITLLPEKVSEDFKSTLKKILESSKKTMTEICSEVANEILVKSSASESLLRTRLSLTGGEVQTIMIYPPPPAKGGISINTEDYACLGEDQFLNDVIIDFYLKYLMQSVLSEVDRERTHVFSSFFYKRLTSRPKTKGRRHPIEDDPKLSPAEKRHARVKTWTKNVNLFTKDFIIIPINENCHWFLAIICFPGQDGCRRMSDNTPIEIPKSPLTTAAAVAAAAAAATTSAKLKVQNNVMSIGATTITPVKAPPTATITLDHNGEEGSDRDEAEGDEEEMDESTTDDEETGQPVEESNGSKEAETKPETEPSPSPACESAAVVPPGKKVKVPPREGIKQPCILIFDSLVGAPRYRVAATLREYLSIEFKVKEGKPKDFTKDTIKGMLPKVPQQTNFTDCGLYLLQYVEMFFKDPVKDYHPPIKQLMTWFPEEVVTRKREDIVNLLKDLMREQKIDPTSLNLPKLTFNYAMLKAQQMAEDEEARARLALADSEADLEEKRERARKQLAQLTGKPYVPLETIRRTKVEPMEQDVSCQNEEVVPHRTEVGINSTDSQTLQTCEEKCENTETSTSDSENVKKISCLNQSLVDYSESSNDSSGESSLVKRTQCTTDEEDVIDRKKRKAD